MRELDQLLATVSDYGGKESILVVEEAARIAEASHRGFFRLDGNPYIVHPIGVATILSQWYAPPNIVAAALLHDVLHPLYSNSSFLTELERKFDSEIVALVREVARLGRFGPSIGKPSAEGTLEMQGAGQAATVPWILAVLRRNPFAVVIKIADRLHNLGGLENLPREHREELAGSSLNIFAALADRLGLRVARRILENESFRILDPERYSKISIAYESARAKINVESILDNLKCVLKQVDISARIVPQFFTPHEVSKRGYESRKPIKSSNVFAATVITDSTKNCYNMLYALHGRYKPLDSIHDYIASHRENGYRALETRVAYAQLGALNVGICTEAMYLVSEYGITAAWRGVDNSLLPDIEPLSPPPKGQIAVLTPKGDVKPLPEGATPVDFAYAIHTDIGHRCMRVRINGREGKLNQILQSGDIVEIVQSSGVRGPEPEWLDFVVTPTAKKKIKAWLDLQRPETLESGRQRLETKLRELGLTLSDQTVLVALRRAAAKLGNRTTDQLLISVQIEPETLDTVVTAIRDFMKGESAVEPMRVIVGTGADAHFPKRSAKCCNPFPPDEIVGYVSRKQIVVHRRGCGKISKSATLIPVHWGTIPSSFAIEMLVEGWNRTGLVRDVSSAVSSEGCDMTMFEAWVLNEGSAVIRMGLGYLPYERLAQLERRIKSITDIRNVESRGGARKTQSASTRPLQHRRTANPYNTTHPARHTFKGRGQEIDAVIGKLRGQYQDNALLLYGQQRIGKTSLLEKLLDVLRGPEYLPVRIDMQGLSGETTGMFLHRLAVGIAERIGRPDINPPMPHKMKRQPIYYFQRFIDYLDPLIPHHILVVLDEFQLLNVLKEYEIIEGREVETATKRDLFHCLRHLLQHRMTVNFLFSGGGLYSELVENSGMSSLLGVTDAVKIDCLDREAARELIMEPTPSVEYEERAIEILLDVTGCHPCYIQHLCSTLIRDRGDVGVVTGADVEAVIHESLAWRPALEAIVNHFWHMGLTDKTRIENNHRVLHAIAAWQRIRDWVPIERITDEVRGAMSKTEVQHSLSNLFEYGSILKADGYRVKIKLVEMWLRQTA